MTSVELLKNEKVHTCAKVHTCTCGKDFLSTSNLNQHKKIQSNENLFICDLCRKSFIKKSNFLKHLKTHDTGEQFSFRCDKCEQVFTRKDNLEGHLKSHESSRFPPRECDRVFGRQFELRQHILTQPNSLVYLV